MTEDPWTPLGAWSTAWVLMNERMDIFMNTQKTWMTCSLLLMGVFCHAEQLKPGGSVNMRDYEFPVVSMVDGHPVYMIGDVAIYGVSPTSVPGLMLQENNHDPVTKIVPKKSYEIRSNYIGVNPSRLPSSAKNEELPYTEVHAIDGDPITAWVDRGSWPAGSEEPWIRIDLPRPTLIDHVKLVPPKHFPIFTTQPDGMWTWPGLVPEHYLIQVSTNGTTWQTIREVQDQPIPGTLQDHKSGTKASIQVLQFEIGKVIHGLRIIAKKTRQFFSGFGFGLAELELIDQAGRNMALVSNGGMVFVSSTNYGFQNRRQTRQDLWPLMYDLGVKWVRTGYWTDTTTWFYVEKTPGVMKLDPVTKDALIEATDYGVTVAQCLYTMPMFRGAPVYQNSYPGVDHGNVFRSYHTIHNHPKTREQFDAWREYVRFMIRELGEYVRYWEIWNEYFDVSSSPDWPETDEPYDDYTELLRVASEEIRGANPDHKIIWGAMVPFLVPRIFEALLSRGAGQLGDFVAWHPYQPGRPEVLAPQRRDVALPDYPEITTSQQMLDKGREIAARHDYRGGFIANEYWHGTRPPSNELEKAKYGLRNAILHASNDILFFWCETWHNYNPKATAGLLRVGPSGSPDTSQAPAPVYYGLRTLCTVMDEARPTSTLDISAGNQTDAIEIHEFSSPGGKLIALWRPIDADDTSQAIKTDVLIQGKRTDGLEILDILNGTTQKGQFHHVNNGTLVPDLLVRDFPVFLKLTGTDHAS